MYIFKKTDYDGNGSISLEQIVMMFQNYGIAVMDPRLMKLDMSQNSQISIRYEERKVEVQSKMVKFFTRLYRMIEKNKLTLKKVFNDFDKSKKGYLIYPQFKEMAQKLLKEITDEDALIAFKLIDDNSSETIDFHKLSRHYIKINELENFK